MILQDPDSKPNSDRFGKFDDLTIVNALKIPNQINFGLERSLTYAKALNQFQFKCVVSHFRKGKHSNIHICLDLCFTGQHCQGSKAVNMDGQ